MNFYNVDKMEASRNLDAVRAEHNQKGYLPVDKQWVLNYMAASDRQARERDMRYQADFARVESVEILKVQVKILKEQVETLRDLSAASSKDAAKARRVALVANIISIASLAVAVLALVMK